MGVLHFCGEGFSIPTVQAAGRLCFKGENQISHMAGENHPCEQLGSLRFMEIIMIFLLGDGRKGLIFHW